MQQNKTQSLSYIKFGSVIDHIPDGQALKLLHLLGLEAYSRQISIGLHMYSPSLGRKDMIKIEGKQLSPEEANKVAILAPEATISLIADYDIQRKFPVSLPDMIERVLACPNPQCITNSEPCSTKFTVRQLRSKVLMHCHHCRRLFAQDEIKRYNS